MIPLGDSWSTVAIVLSLVGASICYTRLQSWGQAPQPVDTREKSHSVKIQRLASYLLSILQTLINHGSLFIRSRRSKPVEAGERPNSARIKDLKPFELRHEVASTLVELFEKDGAGAWPPKANHDAWPLALRPYKDIYLELVPLLPTSEPSLDHEINNERREHYRSLMRKLLIERVKIARVQTIMAAVEAGNWDLFPRDAYNGFYCCVAVCRHAYR